MQSQASNPVRRWRIVAGIAALVLALSGIALVPPGTLPYPPRSTYSDAEVSHWPNAYFLREAVLGQHTWPFWNPSKMLGQPFAANPLSKVWYPPQWLVFILPPTAHLDFLIYLHLAWLGIGIVTLARAERLRMVTALFMALAWGLNPKLVGHLGAGHLDILYALSWVPWAMWAAWRLITRPGIGRGVFLGATVALMALADVRITAYFIPVMLIYGLMTLRGSQNARGVVPGGISAAVTAVLLTAVMSIPLLAIGGYLTRSGITPQDAAEFSLPPHYLIGLILPDLGGQHEWMTALGLPVIVLAVIGLRHPEYRQRALVWWGVVVVAVLWALGSFGPFFLPAVRIFPMLTWLRVPSRSWFVVAFCMMLLSGLGLEALLMRGVGRYGRLVGVAMTAAGLLTLAAAGLLPSLPGVVAGVGASISGTGLGLWIAGGARPEESAKSIDTSLLGAGVLIATLALSLTGLDLTLVVPRSIPDIERPELAIISQLGGQCADVYSPTFELIGPATIASGIATLHGVDPFQLRGSEELIAAAAGVSPHGYSVIAPPMPLGETDLSRVQPRLDLLRAAGVCAVVSSFPLDIPGLDRIGRSGQVTIYRLTEAPPAAAGVMWRPFVLGFNPVSTQVCADPGSALPLTVMIPQSWAPSWEAWLDGQLASLHSVADGGSMALQIDSAGCHTLALAYRPLPDLIGLGISSVSCLAILAGWLISRRRAIHV